MPRQDLVPVSAVIATADRAERLGKTLQSLAAQVVHPSEIIVVDASDGGNTRQLCQDGITGLDSRIRWQAARARGAATQRMEGLALAAQDVIWFIDDDILLEPEAVRRLYDALRSDVALGGVNAMIVNQRYTPPGKVSRTLFRLLHGRSEASFAGRVIGPGVNLLPEDSENLPEIVPVEWLNTTCTMYRRNALPNPPFDTFFTGYSMMEDLALSLKVARSGWKLANVRTARIIHDSQPGVDKNNAAALAEMELRNRHYVMTSILGRSTASDYLRLMIWELFGLVTGSMSRGGRFELPAVIAGKARALVGLGQSHGRGAK